ncbi:hypothetical protein J437_LFUL018950 [Ladona fulva]|uniref:Alpha-N-acetylglucosaminidase n=1 Tax=Ladona fulva TaxID=123851 RepID=A0A8K0P7Q2_LADFU|nr:hypothetical protein J437_LFUL018950 [Ladona fulva]
MNSQNVLAFLTLHLFILGCKAQDFTRDLNNLRSSTPPQVQESAVNDLIRRILPTKAEFFRISIVPPEDPAEKDAFVVESEDGLVNITANSGVAAAHGFHYYLKNICKCHISWDGNQLSLPDILPPASLNVTASDRFRYFGNVCVASYSWVWWDWSKWENHLDWLALNGMNLVLAPTAQEIIWIRLFTKLGLTQDEIQSHLTGPGFHAWQGKNGGRMGNIRGWGGPININSLWYQERLRLQQRILARMRSFGMMPVLPAFAGHVPLAFQRQLIDEFGTDHVYSADPFNEMTPQFNNSEYLSAVSQSILRGMDRADPKAIWQGKLLILDLASETREQYTRLDYYFGHYFIWCMLHNFGGTIGLYGVLDNVNELVYEGRYGENSTMVGIGLTPEGIGQNYVAYDFMLETGWRTEPVNMTKWFADYSTRRYGIEDDKAVAAWEYLMSSVYVHNRTVPYNRRNFLIGRPNLKNKPTIWYRSNELLLAWDNLLGITENITSGIEPYQYDVVDVTREALVLHAAYYYTMMTNAFKHNISSDFQLNAEQFQHILEDLDWILGSHRSFLLGRWLADAKAAATTSEELHLFERSARHQITLWGPNGEIMDYAGKQWAGIVQQYFTPRWALFIKRLNDCLEAGTLNFDQQKFNAEVFSEVEKKFSMDFNIYPATPQGDPVLIAKAIHQKWRSAKKRFSQTLTKMHNQYLNRVHKRQTRP